MVEAVQHYSERSVGEVRVGYVPCALDHLVQSTQGINADSGPEHRSCQVFVRAAGRHHVSCESNGCRGNHGRQRRAMEHTTHISRSPRLTPKVWLRRGERSTRDYLISLTRVGGGDLGLRGGTVRRW